MGKISKNIPNPVSRALDICIKLSNVANSNGFNISLYLISCNTVLRNCVKLFLADVS